jgi:hypothetical protein
MPPVVKVEENFFGWYAGQDVPNEVTRAAQPLAVSGATWG